MQDLTPNATPEQLVAAFKAIVGGRHVITNAKSMERFCKGFRSGEGKALAVVRPGTLLEQWRILKACVAADKIVIFQAANTGLTEGSTPKGNMTGTRSWSAPHAWTLSRS